MLNIIGARWQQGHRTMRYPDGPPPELPVRFAGRPTVELGKCRSDCRRCAESCPTDAIETGPDGRFTVLDLGKCLFCRDCQRVCPESAIDFTREYRLAASHRDALKMTSGSEPTAVKIADELRRILGRSLRLRQVSAGGCNACEADANVLNTVGWDLSRFGIQFVASPRHADGLLVTGPVPENMKLALEKTYHAVPSPKIVIAVGACAISGGPYAGHEEVCNGAGSIVPVDVMVPGCPPHPLTLLHALLSVIGRIA